MVSAKQRCRQVKDSPPNLRPSLGSSFRRRSCRTGLQKRQAIRGLQRFPGGTRGRPATAYALLGLAGTFERERGVVRTGRRRGNTPGAQSIVLRTLQMQNMVCPKYRDLVPF